MLNWRERLFKRILLVADILMILFSVNVFSNFLQISHGDSLYNSILERLGLSMFFIFYNILLIVIFHMYEMFIKNNNRINFRVFVYCLTLPVFATIITHYTLLILKVRINTDVYFNYTLVVIASLLFNRTIIYILSSRKKDENIVILGCSEKGVKYMEEIKKRKYLAVNIIGYISLNGESIEGYKDIEYLGPIKDLENILENHVIDQITMVTDYICEKQVENYVNKCEDRGIVFTLLLDFESSDLFRVSSEMVGSLTSVKVHAISLDEGQLFIKRTMDIIISIFGFIVFLILYLLVGPFIKLTSKGPVLFKQKRMGKNGRVFEIYKFRTMTLDAEKEKEGLMELNEMDRNLFKLKNDPRITKVGKILRKTSIDEFPQFINVLKGDMSVVGTRPPTLDEVEGYTDYEHRRLSILPGITGIWQTNGRSEITSFDEILEMEAYYIRNWSVLLDLFIVLKTIKVVLSCKGSG